MWVSDLVIGAACAACARSAFSMALLRLSPIGCCCVANRLVGIGAFLWFALRPLWRSRRCKLLTEPPVVFMWQQSVFDDLRRLADEMGLPWPYLRSVEVHGLPYDAPELHLHVGAGIPTAMHFAVWVPGYQAEQITVTGIVPTDTDSLLALVQLHRDQVQSERFPILLAVIPQPCPAWGLLVAAPAWAPSFPLAVFDLWRLTGVSSPFRCLLWLLFTFCCKSRRCRRAWMSMCSLGLMSLRCPLVGSCAFCKGKL